MIQINLLPARIKKRKRSGVQFLPVYFLCIVLAVFVMGYVWNAQNKKEAALKQQLSKLQQDVAKYARFDAMLKELTAQKEVIDKKGDIIKTLQNGRDTIVRLLTQMSVQIPVEKMWFERLIQSTTMITVEGVAQSNEAIAEFMKNLESSPHVEKGSVNLTHSRQALMSNMKLREFQVTYRFSPVAEPQKQLQVKAQ